MIKQSLHEPWRRHAIGADDPVEIRAVAGTEVAIKRWGAGPPVLCLHAVGHGSGDFAQLAALVAGDFELICVDWPGQGRSPPADFPVDADRYAELALALCDALSLHKPIVIGNSIGGAAAIVAAAKHPHRFSALVLCNAGGLAPLDWSARFVIGRMARFFSAGARGAWWFDAAFAAYYRAFVLPAAAAAPQRRRIAAAGRELAPLLAEAWRGFARSNADLRHLPARITIPVWLAWAKDDKFVSWTRTKSAAARFPDRKLTLFSGAHCAFLEQPEEFATEFRAFAARLQQERDD